MGRPSSGYAPTAGCGLDRLVPFSCKGRAVCPSCGGRRMAERTAHPVDQVFPEVPVREWVLSLPHRLRYVLAWAHALCRAVSGVFVRAVLAYLRRRARHAGAPGGRGGAVAIIQRFGAALNLNVHLHVLALDGVYVEGDGGTVRFHETVPPTDEEIYRLLATIDQPGNGRIRAWRCTPGSRIRSLATPAAMVGGAWKLPSRDTRRCPLPTCGTSW